MSFESEYNREERRGLQAFANHLLGWEIAFHDLHIEANTSAGIKERIFDSRDKAIIAISAIDFYPTQSSSWQEKIERGGKSRKPMQIYSDFNNANPLVSVVLQRGARAKSDPLAVIKRVIAATGKKTASEYTWKALLTKLGISAEQLPQTMQAMNFANVLEPKSPVRLRKIPQEELEIEEHTLPDSAHNDLQSKLALSTDAKEVLKQNLQRLMQRRNP